MTDRQRLIDQVIADVRAAKERAIDEERYDDLAEWRDVEKRLITVRGLADPAAGDGRG